MTLWCWAAYIYSPDLGAAFTIPSDLWSTERKSWHIAGWKILVDQLTSISFGLTRCRTPRAAHCARAAGVDP